MWEYWFQYLLLFYLLLMCLEGQERMAQVQGPFPAIPVGGLAGVLGSWLPPDSVPAALAIWGVNQ